MVRVYLAGPDHAPQDRSVLEAVASVVADLGHDAFVPHREVARHATLDGAGKFRFLLQGIDTCDAVIAILDGADVDATAAFCMGQAYALRRPILALRSDARDAELGPRHAARELHAVASWTPESLRPLIDPFLAGVRVFAGTLVRDAVPQLLKDEGRALKFRNVNPNEYPLVLKRKLVETVRRLEETDFGVEQEEIADVLELLETLINLRKYDKEGLRSIKEGKWRKRGGFERGFLLEEEPKASPPQSG